MTRTRLCDRELPTYSAHEEIFNMVSHIVGGAVGIATLVLCVIIAAIDKNVMGGVTSAVFGASMITLYTMSSVYHGLKHKTAKKVFQVIDHCTIYFLIAGTYTPMVLCGLMKTAPVWAWIIFSIVWGCAALATTLTAIDLKKYKAFSMICYIAMGWAILLSIKNMYYALGQAGFALLLAGGVFYTGGVVFYKLGSNKRYFHSIFHLFTLVGSIAHALCVMFYVL